MCRNYIARFNLLSFFTFMFVIGFISVYNQYEISWDFANYHFYNPWAFLNNRVNYDIAVGALNSYLNPLMDIPLYLLIKYFNDYPDFILFIQGIWACLLFFVFFKLVLLYFDWNSLEGKAAVFFTLLIALTGNAFFLQIGTSSNEIPIAFLEMTAFYFLVKEIFFIKGNRLSVFMLSGFLLGSAMGLKLTAVIYCMSMGLTLILFYRKFDKPWQKISLFTLAGLCGFLVFNGFWMWKMWQEFQNPFFPFANAIFKSEFFYIENLRDESFLPNGWKQILFWPFFLSFKFLVSNLGMLVIDFRPALIFIIFLIYVFKQTVVRVRSKRFDIKPDFAFLIVFTLLSFILWEAVFSIVRYYIIIEMIGAIFIVKALGGYTFKSFIVEGLYYSFIFFLLYILISTPYFSDSWGSRKDVEQSYFDKNRFVNIEKVNIPDNTLIMIYNYPVSMAVPVLAERTKNLRAVVYRKRMKFYNSSKDIFDFPKWQKLRDEVVNNHRGPKFAMFAFRKGYRLNMTRIVKDKKCRSLKNNIGISWFLCVPEEWSDYVWNKN